MKNPVSITSVSTISPLGKSDDDIWENYQSQRHFLSEETIQEQVFLAGTLPPSIKNEIENLKTENSKYRHLDPSVLYAILASRGIENHQPGAGLNIGSSRGATSLFEKYYSEFLETGKASTYTSPSTTLGNISSWVAQDLQLNGPQFSHSVTCSTGMHAILNGIAWLESGMAENFLVGGSEAPLTAFTIAQMKAMKIYARENSDFPCRALDMNKSGNTMVLSEAAGILSIEKGRKENAIGIIRGVGFANENLTHGASLSKNGECLQKSMKMAMQSINPAEVDAVVMHAPGTIGGDLAEVNAVKEVFNTIPALTSNKWKLGHSFAASGILSIHMALLMLQHQKFLPVPFSEFQKEPEKLENILVNSVGFGGNAVSVLVSRN